MTTRTRRRISTDDLNTEVQRLLSRDPDLSRTAITKQLRESGVAVGSERIRGAVRIGKAAALLRLVVPGANLLTAALGIVGKIKSPSRTLLAAGATAKEGTRPDTATFAAIDWRVVYAVNVFLRGQLARRIDGSITGRTVQDIRRYNRDLIETQIQNQIQGRLYNQFESPGDSDLYDYEFTRFDVEIVNVELRGDSNRGRNRTEGSGRARRTARA